MADYAQSQQDPMYGQGKLTLGMPESVLLVRGTNLHTSVGINGSIKKGGDGGLAHAAENIARWRTYLPEDCVKSMMNHGWHWST
jgi:hypothetical protein